MALIGVTLALMAAPDARPNILAFLSHADGRELRHLHRFGKHITVVAPNWYELDARRGRISGPWTRVPVLRAARRHSIGVWPVINAADGAAIARARPRRRVVRAVTRLALRYRYAGLTLDIEGLRPAHREAYTNLVRRVGRRLHAHSADLAVYAPRPTQSYGEGAYDWDALADAADLLLVSGANEHPAAGAPGPIVTSAGFRTVLDRAAHLPRDRVAPVLAAYGHSWPAGGGKARLVSTVDAERLARRCHAKVVRRDGGGRFRCRRRVIAFETRAGIAARARAARDAGMRWIGLFSLGREPASVWRSLG